MAGTSMNNAAKITPLSAVNHSKIVKGAGSLSLVNLNTIFTVAMRNRFGVPAINVRSFPLAKEGNFDNGYLGPSTAVAALRAMRVLDAPLIIEIAQSEISYAGPVKWHGEQGGFEQFVKHIIAEARRMEIKQPLAIHFDHGAKTEWMEHAVKAGFTSVALDGGNIEKWDDLIATAREWVNYCHLKGITVEGEIELVDKADPTDPKQAIEFVKLTGVDVIVVTLPKSVHGAQRGESALDLDRLLEVARAVPNTPVNLHGGSGFSLEDLRAAVEAGGAHKVNYATNVQRAMFKAVPGLLPVLNERAQQAGIIKGEDMVKAEKDPKVARKGLYLLENVIVTMGADAVRTAEDAMTAEIISVMRALKNEGTAKLYPG